LIGKELGAARAAVTEEGRLAQPERERTRHVAAADETELHGFAGAG
jgi:hypothetical protein